MHQTKRHLCGDGSHTLHSKKFNQFFHNPNGAIAESRHVFFETPGLIRRTGSVHPFRIFEVGFGTGLNFLVLLDELRHLDPAPEVVYRSVEAYPLVHSQVMPLNYPGKLGLEPDLQGRIFQDLKPGFNEIRIHPNITLELFVGLFEQVPDTGDRFHSIFFDPFSPDVNPELWTPDVFRKLASVSDTDVLLSTYGAASKARAAMAAAGWSVARAPGALGKREMTLAALNPARLSGWKRLDETRLSERYQKGEFDEQRNG